ncbi:flagellar motor protein MotB [Acetobacter oeni]|uniref:Flagellar motor protein MotB n=1 Tax=Acetobacter oeni TaxID=304077 RepID=A0A511XG30_9PROT|nr:flagellar motor protein MotB [Acetobacter oeni]MBB3882167.1 chemotaxis protein MotB [Acetobacter oeni]GBR01462.1 flagellar motor protein MotB [Acetobacter oeni LMG 21952]GEN61913.1 flagellar motor protein MotB [Acetobacter oeni]
MPKKGDNKATIVVIRRSGGGGGHHGGAWKIAYADFVTAMMAFFLVMWLINATTEQRRRGIANVFNPMSSEGSASAQAASEPGASVDSGASNAQDTKSGASASAGDTKSTAGKSSKDAQAVAPRGLAPGKGGVAAPSGGFGPDIGAVRGDNTAGAGKNRQQAGTIRVPAPSFPDRSIGTIALAPPDVARIVPIGGEKSGAVVSFGDGHQSDARDAAKHEQEDLERDARQLKAALASDPAGGQAARQLSIDVVPEGLRIQLSESEQKPMFDTGSARLNTRAAHLLGVIAPYLIAMPQTLSIYGYTDGAVFHNSSSSNWTLSGARADSARSILTQDGFPERRLVEVSGRADRELARPDDPGAAANRRVVLLLHRDHDVTVPAPTSVTNATPVASDPPASGAPTSGVNAAAPAQSDPPT